MPGAVLLLLVLLLAAAAPARAAEYPSWDDVQEARTDASKKATQIARIERLLTESKEAAAEARAVAVARSRVYEQLRENADTANDRLLEIEAEVEADRREAGAATQRAGRLAAQLARTGSADLQATMLLTSGDDATTFLNRLGSLTKLTESNGRIAEAARQARNAAAATQAQAEAQRDALSALQDKAQQALDEARRASDDADQQVERQQAAQSTLTAQLAVLKSKQSTTLQQYKAGIAAAERARKAAATKAAAPPAGTSPAADRSAPSSSGWTKPAYGYLASRYGPRPDRPAGARAYHRGTDIAASCGAPVYAATAGRVTYSGWLGTYGYYVEIDHGGGITTGYAHNSRLFVTVGQQVATGQNIAAIGTTGASTGCHSHFETRINGVAVDPEPFMAARGTPLG